MLWGGGKEERERLARSDKGLEGSILQGSVCEKKSGQSWGVSVHGERMETGDCWEKPVQKITLPLIQKEGNIARGVLGGGVD